ncbi:hypothetical protein [Maricaulis sp.]|uniref:hypothetical protein n=1 Tax=Maricaulis sp. TaxID=1486257 RepID=UPI0025C48DC0|nr:hypothetical protein [Maricaulis sp.]
MRRFLTLIALLGLAPVLSGCIVIGAAALATDVAVGTAGAAVRTVGAVGGAAIDVVTPGDDDDDHHHDHDHD